MAEDRMQRLEDRLLELIISRTEDATRIAQLTANIEKLNENMIILNENMNKGKGALAAAAALIAAISAALGALLTAYVSK